jgi:predicted RNase H-like nuclease (RuvC/YqgF family)
MATSTGAPCVAFTSEISMMQPFTTKPTTKQEMLEWIEWAESKMKALEARVQSLKEENSKYKQTIRNMDRRIMKGKM